MQVRVRLFAAAKQYAGADTISLDVADAPTVSDIRSELIKRIPELDVLSEHLRFSVDASYVTDDTVIHESNEVACIPPVSGG